MQHHIPLQDIPHTICCLALTLSYQLISFFLLDKKIQQVTMKSGLLFTRIVYVMLISKHKTSLEQKLHCESNSLTATEMSNRTTCRLERVFTRSHPTGRAKIQDKWNSKVYKVVNRRDHVYEIEPADGQGPTRTVNRSELQVCPKPKPRLPPRFPPRVRRHPPRINRAPPSESSGDSSDDSDDIFIAFRTPQDPVPIPAAEPEKPPLHRSARLNKGQQANHYRQPRTINN